MKRPVVVVGIGELGELFALAFLKQGHPVYPVLRGTDLKALAAAVPEPELVLLAVGENDLHPMLESLPASWLGRLGLLQNELLPCDWLRHGIQDPTVIVVWFDKKKGRPFMVPQPSPVCGPKTGLVVQALQAIEVPCHPIPSGELLYELARKNLYLLTINLAGLALPPGTTIGELWNGHRELAEQTAKEILDIQEWLAQSPLPRQRLMAGMLEGFAGDPAHICAGRTAPQRLERALGHARQAGLEVPTLNRIAATIGP